MRGIIRIAVLDRKLTLDLGLGSGMSLRHRLARLGARLVRQRGEGDGIAERAGAACRVSPQLLQLLAVGVRLGDGFRNDTPFSGRHHQNVVDDGVDSNSSRHLLFLSISSHDGVF